MHFDVIHKVIKVLLYIGSLGQPMYVTVAKCTAQEWRGNIWRSPKWEEKIPRGICPEEHCPTPHFQHVAYITVFRTYIDIQHTLNNQQRSKPPNHRFNNAELCTSLIQGPESKKDCATAAILAPRRLVNWRIIIIRQSSLQNDSNHIIQSKNIPRS